MKAVCFELFHLLHGISLDDIITLQPVEECPQIANVIVDCADAYGLTKIPPPIGTGG